MARAKRTERADARRRHRAAMAAADAEALESADEGEAAVPASVAPPSPGGSRRKAPATPSLTPAGPRPRPGGGMREAFRLAFTPLNLRQDLALLPQLIAHRAFWLPLLIAGVVAGAVIAFNGRELITRFALTYFLFPPPIGGIFLAGFLAPRASYLIGLLYGVISSVLLAVVAAAVPSLFPGFSFGDALLSGLATSPVSGILFGSAAAWYRRFLFLASPARQGAPRAAAQRGRPARGR